jgi:drug/metabolite transporter (DMT)-like permease
MLKFFVILFIGLVFESTGIVLLKKGMTQIGDMPHVSASEILGVVKAGVTNTHILLGVFFEALFFACLLVLMSGNEISFLWPMTSLTFVFATFAAILFLHERVSPIRWVGVVFIMIGAAFISYSEHKPKPSGQPAANTTAPSALK